MRNFKVHLSISDDTIKKDLEECIKKTFTLCQEGGANCDVYLSDNQANKNENCINILIAHIDKIPEFKGAKNLQGFDHYVIYNETDFLEDRVIKTLKRQFHLKNQKNSNELFGVKTIISLEPFEHPSGAKLPIIVKHKVKASKERTIFADELEKFIDSLEPIMGRKNPTLVQYAVEIQEELLMNAIWDANPKYADKPRTVPVELDPSEEVDLEWAFNGKELGISVKDNFGRLNPNIMDKYINFIFKTGTEPSHNLNEQGVSAGLGMYMILQRANLLSVFVLNGKATDVAVVIRLSERKRTKSNAPKAIDIIHVKN